MAVNWEIQAMPAVMEMLHRGADCCACDLLEAVGVPDAGHAANALNNKVGPFINSLGRRGWLESTGISHQSRSSHRRGGRHLMWRVTPRGKAIADAYFEGRS